MFKCLDDRARRRDIHVEHPVKPDIGVVASALVSLVVANVEAVGNAEQCLRVLVEDGLVEVLAQRFEHASQQRECSLLVLDARSSPPELLDCCLERLAQGERDLRCNWVVEERAQFVGRKLDDVTCFGQLHRRDMKGQVTVEPRSELQLTSRLIELLSLPVVLSDRFGDDVGVEVFQGVPKHVLILAPGCWRARDPILLVAHERSIDITSAHSVQKVRLGDARRPMCKPKVLSLRFECPIEVALKSQGFDPAPDKVCEVGVR
jgi:hypothetical protein